MTRARARADRPSWVVQVATQRPDVVPALSDVVFGAVRRVPARSPRQPLVPTVPPRQAAERPPGERHVASRHR